MRTICALLLAAVCSLLAVAPLRADFPKPSIYPISWELKFDHSKAKRIVVKAPGQSVAQAYWYVAYTVTNNSDQDQTFLPDFEMLTRDGKLIRSDFNIPPAVLDAIRDVERDNTILPAVQIAGVLRIGEDQAKEGVAIWPEPDTRMGTFSIFIAGLSGEIVQLKDDNGKPMKNSDGQPVILRKTLELTYQIPGDEVFAGEDAVIDKGSEWVMR